jgi:hypothetical protein
MVWTMPWYTMTDGFDADFGVDEWHGTNAFIRDADRSDQERPSPPAGGTLATVPDEL